MFLDTHQVIDFGGSLALVKELDEPRGGDNQHPTASFYIDAERNKQQLTLGEPIVVKRVQREPGVIMSITLWG